MAFGRIGSLGAGFGRLGAIGSGEAFPDLPAPILVSASAVDFSDVFVWGQATTDTASGTLYAVAVPGAAATPSAAQIVAGTDAAGAAAPNANIAITSTGVKQVLVRGLTAVTAYKVCMAQRDGANDSNVVTGSFTTDTLVIAFAANGATTNMTFTGLSVGTPNIADPHGGTNAVRFTDNNDAATGGVSCGCTVATFFGGVNKFHMTVKHQGGAAHLRIATSSITASPTIGNTHWNTSTGALGNQGIGGWTPTPVTFDLSPLGGAAVGWRMWSTAANCAGADVTGTLGINKCLTDNVINTVVRDGTNIQDLYNIRITRV